MEPLAKELRKLMPSGSVRPDPESQVQRSVAEVDADELKRLLDRTGLNVNAPAPPSDFTWFKPSIQPPKARKEARQLLAAFEAWTDGSAPATLTVMGGAGIGKSELARTAIWKLPGAYYITAAEFDKRVKTFASNYGMPGGVSVDPDTWVERLALAENLVIDDVAAGYIDKGWTASRLERLIDLREASKRRTVVITNLSRDELYLEVGGRVFSRITDALNAVVVEPKYMVDVRQLANRN